jgi:hypothetical protein
VAASTIFLPVVSQHASIASVGLFFRAFTAAESLELSLRIFDNQALIWDKQRPRDLNNCRLGCSIPRSIDPLSALGRRNGQRGSPMVRERETAAWRGASA